ncbi:MAG: beta-lactamase family protein [Herpetosiphonaceae bacterium]|nr:beta-lactamase family protein [Herpetosiphonaceae bacterium]
MNTTVGDGSPNVVTMPNTPVGQQLARWFQIFNSGDLATIRDLAATLYAPTAHYADSSLAQYPEAERTSGNWAVKLYSDNRGLIPYGIERATEDELVILVQERYSVDTGWAKVACTVDSAPPHPITAWAIHPMASPVVLGTPTVDKNAFIMAELERYLDQIVVADLFSGAVLVARDGTPIFMQAYGLAHKGYNVRNHVDTKFNVASVNKMFTALAIVQLAERGLLSFDDRLRTFLRDYPNPAADIITLHQLLTHTSGLEPSILNQETFWAHKERVRTIADWMALLMDAPLLFEPGTRWSYSNRGFLLLGAVIEQVTQQTYFDYVRDNIYRPAGMRNTNACELDEDVEDRALGYMHEGLASPFELHPRRNNLPFSVIKGSPHGNGGAYSTVTDLLQFATALQQHRLLSPMYTQILLGNKVATGRKENEHYGYGCFTEQVNGHVITGHAGTLAGVNAWLDLYRDLGYTVVVLANYDLPAAQRVGKKLRYLLTSA